VKISKSFSNILNQTKEQIHELEDASFEMIRGIKRRKNEKRPKIAWDSGDTNKKTIYTLLEAKKENRGREKNCKKG
jgi:hypothetical protein